jgi:predicted dehydrogenase
MQRKVKTGIVGCGKISEAYFEGCKRYDVLEVVACADLDPTRAQAQAARHGARACPVDELLHDPEIEIVVNLTIPQAHVAVNTAALDAGNHVYCEKPFAFDSGEGRKVLALARKQRCLVGCAPDTFLGGGLQTCRKLVDDGAIGRPVAALAFLMNHGPEGWHPSPQFYYQKGGGPMFDMGPYYLTALINLLGPVARVCGMARKHFAERTITSHPFAGTKIPVETPTHLTGTLDFSNGAVATMVMSFDTWPGPALPCIAVYGTEGSLEVPDPNRFDGAVRLFKPGVKEPQEVPLTHTADRGRGTGVADLAYSILRRGRPHRANGALANHVVEVMEAFEQSSTAGRHVKIRSTCERPAMLPVGLAPNVLDE